MVLVSFAFVVLRILSNLFFMQNSLNVNSLDLSEISNTVQRDFTFILNIFSESSIHFAQFSVVLANFFFSFTQSGLNQNRGCVTIRKYAGTCKGICSYNLVGNFLIQLLSLQNSVFAMHFSNAILAWERGISKR